MRKIVVFLIVTLLLYLQSVYSQTVPTGFVTTAIGSGWSQPVGAVFNYDAATNQSPELFVWDKSGKVYVCHRNASGDYIKQTTPVLDISEEVGDWRDHGLLGFALDPDFKSNGLIYLLYVVDGHYLLNFGTASYNATTNQYYAATIGRVTRYKTAKSSGVRLADITTRKILLGETKETGIPILYESHGIGSLAFASDGMLLVSAGDGASYSATDGGNVGHTYYADALAKGIIRDAENVGSFRSQLINSHNGKLLRIDPVTGDGVSSNPFYDENNKRAPKSRVWALGFRNPFRITVRPGTGSANPTTGDIGEVYVGDVGWNVWEEMNIVKAAGMNFGWPIFEGQEFISSYNTGAFLTTPNKDMPNPLFGTGGCTQQFFTFRNLLKQATADNITTAYNPCNTSTVISNNNSNYHARPALDWKHGANSSRVGIFSGNNAAVAEIGTTQSNVTGTPFSGNCTVNGTWYTGNKFPPEYKNTFLQADMGGKWLKRITINYTDVVTRVDNFASGFNSLVCITENPADGSIVTVEIAGTGVKRISYGGNQPPVAVVKADTTYAPSASLTINFKGDGSYDTDGSIPNSGYAWNFGDATTSTAKNPAHTFTAPAGTPKKFVVKLKVTDNQGATHTDSIIVSLNNTPPVVNITSPIKNSLYTIGLDSMYKCTATVTDAEHTSAQLKYEWQTFLRHNNHEHPETIDPLQTTDTRISRIGCNGDTYYWLVNLTVTDAAGLSTKDSTKIFPDCRSQGALPLFLHKFSVTQQNTVNLVKWTTELESNIEFFEVERSSDGVNFVTINRQAAMNDAGTSNYSYRDNSFSSGVNYYRLKIVERGNLLRYSVIIKTVTDGDVHNGFTIAPNPVVGNFSIVYHAVADGVVAISIKDVAGRIVHTLKENVNKGNNAIYIQNLPNWKSGMYFVTIQNGDDVKEGKFIKAQ